MVPLAPAGGGGVPSNIIRFPMTPSVRPSVPYRIPTPSRPYINPQVNSPMGGGTPSGTFPGSSGNSSELEVPDFVTETEKMVGDLQREIDDAKRRNQRQNIPADYPRSEYGKCEDWATEYRKRKECKSKYCCDIKYKAHSVVGQDGVIFAEIGIFGGTTIATNGLHVGVICKDSPPVTRATALAGDGTVYDNNVPLGVPSGVWINMYLVSPPGIPYGAVVSIAGADRLGWGKITVENCSQSK